MSEIECGTRHKYADIFEGKRKPTIDELEDILTDSSVKVSLLPSGEFIINSRISELESLLSAKEKELAEAEKVLKNYADESNWSTQDNYMDDGYTCGTTTYWFGGDDGYNEAKAYFLAKSKKENYEPR